MNWVRHLIIPLIATVFWGTAFVPQEIASQTMDAISLNMVVSWLAFLFLLPCTIAADLFARRQQKKDGTFQELSKEEKKQKTWNAVKGGIACGVPMAVAVILQQEGISLSGAGKSGFLTALYVVFVPVFSIFLGKKAPRRVWLAVLLALVGLYFLCIKPGTDLHIQKGDWFLLGCAITFSIQILAIHHFGQDGNGLKLSCMQSLVTAIVCTLGTVLFADFHWSQFAGSTATIWSVLYVALLSRGLAYTMQFLAQKDANPMLISLIMSLESVFAVLTSAVVLKEYLSGGEYLGCAFVFAAVILSQIPLGTLLQSGKQKLLPDKE